MNDDATQTVKLAGAAEYADALDTICGLAKHSLYIFEKDFLNIGFENSKRFEPLRSLLLANPNNRLQLLASDIRPLTQYCPRLMSLLRQFGHNMYIYQLPKHLQHLTDPFAVADDAHYVRRYHFEDTRGILALNDGEKARQLKSRFIEMWNASNPSPLTSIFTL